MSYKFVEDHREYIQRELYLRIKRRPLYSQRAFCRDLNISPSTLTDFLKNRMALSAGRLTLISKKIGLSLEQRNHWVDLMNYRFNKSPIIKQESYIKIKSRINSEKNAISDDEFKIISEWYHFAFLELIEMDAKKYSNLKNSAQALSITLPELKIAVERLLKIKLLTQLENNIYSVDSNTQVGNHIPSEAVRQFHFQILNMAQRSIEKQGMDERFLTSHFIGLPKDKIEEIMEQLKLVSHKIFEPYVISKDLEEKTELYCFSLQFFNLLNLKGS